MQKKYWLMQTCIFMVYKKRWWAALSPEELGLNLLAICLG